MWVLCRHLSAPPWAAFPIAAGFLFCGFFTGHSEHTGFLFDYAALPWIAWRLDKAVRGKRDRLAALEAGLIWGIAGLSGYPGTTLLVAGIAAAWALVRAALPDEDAAEPPTPPPQAPPNEAPPRGWKPWLRGLGGAVGCLAMMAGTGLVITSPYYVAFSKEGRGLTDRGQALSREEALSMNALLPGAALTLASPYLPALHFHNPDYLWTETDVSSASIYVGTAVVWLALTGLVLRPKDPLRWSLLALALLGLGCAMGKTLPLRGWLYDLLPPFRYFRHSALLRGSYIFFLCILAAIAARDVARWRDGLGRGGDFVRLLVGAGLATCLGLTLGVAPLFGARDGGPDLALAVGHVFVGWLFPLVAVLFLWLGRRSSWWRRAFVPLLCLWAAGDLLATSVLTRFTVCNSTPALVEQWTGLTKNQEHGLSLAKYGLHRELRNPLGPWVNNKHVLLKVPCLVGYYPPAMRNKFYTGWVETPALLGAVVGDRPVWYMASRHVITAPPSDAVFQRFRDRAMQLNTFPLVVHPPETMGAAEETFSAADTERAVAAIGAGQGAMPLQPVVVDYRSDVLTLRVTCPEDGWLVISDRWAPGWQATVNGRPTPVHGGLFLFRAVPVTAGENEVHFEYRPFGHPWLLILSWLTIAGGTAVCVAARQRRRGAPT